MFSIKERRLTYRLASQIYKAQDAEFNNDEIQELFEVSGRLVDYAMNNRKDIQRQVNALWATTLISSFPAN